MSIVIFSGTTEGRILSDCLAEKEIPHYVCVATESGEGVMQANPYAKIHVGRLQADEMEAFLESVGAEQVIDATHPYAKIVTATVQQVCQKQGYDYLRIVRNGDAKSVQTEGNCYDSADACAKALHSTKGNILLTTGSKELKCYTEDKAIRSRLYVRVLPSMEAIQLCIEAGIEESHIIAMYGPHTEELNRAIMKQYHIAHLVTKESGNAGGYTDKLRAAKEVGAALHVICRPHEEAGITLQECLTQLGLERPKTKLCIKLAGIGMGHPDTMTIAVKKAMQEADYVLGAKRMLTAYKGFAKTAAVYMPKDILAYLEQEVLPACEKITFEPEKNSVQVVVLYSGDTGIFSGASGLYQALLAWGKCDSIQILPGISSFSAFSAALGVDYKHARLESLHGLSADRAQLERIQTMLEAKETVYLLMSGQEDFEVLLSCIPGKYRDLVGIDVGYQLSYENQRIDRLRYDSLAQMVVQNEDNPKTDLPEGLYIVRITFEG